MRLNGGLTKEGEVALTYDVDSTIFGRGSVLDTGTPTVIKENILDSAGKPTGEVITRLNIKSDPSIIPFTSDMSFYGSNVRLGEQGKFYGQGGVIHDPLNRVVDLMSNACGHSTQYFKLSRTLLFTHKSHALANVNVRSSVAD